MLLNIGLAREIIGRMNSKQSIKGDVLILKAIHVEGCTVLCQYRNIEVVKLATYFAL